MTAQIVCALRIEAAALHGFPVVRTGMGRKRALAAASNSLLLAGDGAALVIAGFCGAVDPALAPGDVVLATALRSADGHRPCPGAARLEEPLRRLGLRVVSGPVYSAERILGPRERRGLDGVAAVDMETYWLAEAAGDRLLGVVRVVVDAAGRRLLDPRTLPAGVRAFRSLRRTGPALAALGELARPEPLRY